jgi:hypothetical protein
MYGNCTSRPINWEHFLPSNLCTHTMLDAQHKTLTGEKTFMSHYVDNTYCTALQLWQHQHTFLYLVVMSYAHTTWALSYMYNTAKAYIVKSGKFLQIHRQDSNTNLYKYINPHLFHKNQCSVTRLKPELFWEIELKNEDVFLNSVSAGSNSIFSCITHVLNKSHKTTSYRKQCTAQVY